MKSAEVVSIIHIGTSWMWQVYFAFPKAAAHGTAPTFEAAWAAVSAVLGEPTTGRVWPLAGTLNAEAG